MPAHFMDLHFLYKAVVMVITAAVAFHLAALGLYTFLDSIDSEDEPFDC